MTCAKPVLLTFVISKRFMQNMEGKVVENVDIVVLIGKGALFIYLYYA